MSRFMDEILEQPEALHRTLDKAGAELAALADVVAKIRANAFRRVVFTGMGSSYYAAFPALAYLTEQSAFTAHCDALALESSELLYYHGALLNPQTLLVMASQSGQSVEVVKLLEQVKGRVPVIGITNVADSPLGRQSDAVLHTRAGDESTVSTKTYTTTLAVMHLLAHALNGDSLEASTAELRRAADQIRTSLPTWQQTAEAITAALAATRYLTFVGRGPSRASAMTSALIVKESSKMPTEGLIAGQYRHGPMESVAPETGVVLFAPGGRTHKLNRDLGLSLLKLAGKVIWVGAEPLENAARFEVPAVSEWLAPLLEIVPIHFLCAALAAQRGKDVEHFTYGGKVTTIE